MRRENRIRLAGLFIRHTLQMQGFADAIASDGAYGTLGERLRYQVKQLRFGGRDVGYSKLEPYDLGPMLSNVSDTVQRLQRQKLPDLYASPLLAECTRLREELEASGCVPR